MVSSYYCTWILIFGDIVVSDFAVACSNSWRCGWQAFREHKLFDPLCEPGKADLTADVDFKYVSQSVADKGIILVCESVWTVV